MTYFIFAKKFMAVDSKGIPHFEQVVGVDGGMVYSLHPARLLNIACRYEVIYLNYIHEITELTSVVL